MQVEYHFRGQQFLTEDLPNWARNTVAEWQKLFAHSKVVRLAGDTYQKTVLESEDLWVVMFTDGPRCAPCQDARSNLFRMASDLAGHAMVGSADCSQGGLHEWCRQIGADGDYPRFWIFNRGKDKGNGEGLFNAHESPTHVALPLVVKTIKASLADEQKRKDSLMVPDGENEQDGYKPDKEKEEPPPPPPPPPPQQYQQQPPRQNFAQLPQGQNRPNLMQIGRG